MIETYSDLRSAISSWTNNTRSADHAKDYIQLAEARIRNDILIRRMELSVHGEFNGPAIFLPENCEAVERLMYYIGKREYSVPMGNTKSLESLTSSTGEPQGYAIHDQALILYPTPTVGRKYSLYYIPFIADLSDENTTNWLMDRAPNVYLQACLVEAFLHLQDFAAAQQWESRYTQSLDKMFNASERQRMPSNTPLNARPYKAV